MRRATEQIRITDVDGTWHTISVTVCCEYSRFELCAVYDDGMAKALRGTVIARWSADYEKPIPDVDPGKVSIGDGRIDLNAKPLRGIGLGSLLMRPIILWIKAHDEDVPVAPISLSGEDAKSNEARDIRNRFYEKLGFAFEYKDDKSWGESKPIMGRSLITPNAGLSGTWKIESVSNAGSIF